MTSTQAADLPRWHPTVVHALLDAARRSPAAPALRCGDDALDYRAYAACVAGFARELAALAAPGERVALLMGNSVDIAIATFAVQAAGLQLAPLNPASTAFEVAPILASAAPAVLVHDADCAPELLAAAREGGVPHLHAVGPGARLTQWPADALDLAAFPLPEPDALSTLQYTGGTTGRAKGVDLTHRAVATNVSQREVLLPTVDEAERILVVTPMFHVYAVSMGLYLAAYCRGELVLMPRFRADAVLQALQQHRITLFSGSPTIFNGLMSNVGFAATDFSALQLCFSGTAALPEATLRHWEQATGCVVAEGYGQSEAGPVLSFNPRHGQRKPGSVGTPLPQTEIEIVDLDTGTRVLGTGEVGEIRARGPQLMRGYRGLPEETAAALRDGWLYTGDIGELDADGHLYIRDRKKDLVIVGGYNVYPREVEEALHAHPGVAEAAVVGVPDAYRGEALVAYVVCRDGNVSVDALQQHLAQRLLRYKWPAQLHLVPVLPRTAVGKLDKVRLRQQAQQAPQG
jgi:long-chain acyl-CoA synthetase